MRFARFSWCGALSNWGWYSTQEKALLAKEEEVGKYLASLEDFIRSRQTVKNLLHEFQIIQYRSDVNESEYSTLQVKLEHLTQQVKQIRLEVLNQGGEIVPDSKLTFPNHKSSALIGEIRSFLARQKQNRLQRKDPLTSSFVIHYNDRTKEAFESVMNKGFKVLYTVDVEDIISIGSGEHTKHSVVAVGKTCKAAGTAQLEIDDRTDMYKTMKEREQQALDLQKQIDEEVDPKGELQENLDYYKKQAKEISVKLKGYVPPVLETRTVLLDFDSGHYMPSKAWKEAMVAWKNAGYIPKWNPNSLRV